MIESSESLGPVVIFGGVSYQQGANQTSLQMFDALARRRIPVLYVSRVQRGRGWRPIARGGELGRGIRNVSDTAWVLTLPLINDLLPMSAPEAARSVQGRLILRQVSRAIERLAFVQPALLAYWWMFPEIVGSPTWRARVFDVIDRHWDYAWLSSSRAQVERRLVDETVRVADRVFSVSSSLAADLEAARPITVLQNGVDLARVAGVRAANRAPRTAVYCGGWSARVDEELLSETLRRNDAWTFHFIGGATPKWVHRYKNVVDHGDQPYERAIALMKSAHLGLIPFVDTPFTRASNFLKPLDYLASGLTVLSTKLPAMQELARDDARRVLCTDDRGAWFHLDGVCGDIEPAATTSPALVSRSSDARAAVLLEALG